MTPPGRLAEYLKARRERLQPEDAGIAVGSGTRRVPGLRREEVAILAGISTDYYLRLEQGAIPTRPIRCWTRSPGPSDSIRPVLRTSEGSHDPLTPLPAPTMTTTFTRAHGG